MENEKGTIFLLLEKYSNRAYDIDIFFSFFFFAVLFLSIVNIIVFDIPTLMLVFALFRKIYVIGLIDRDMKR